MNSNNTPRERLIRIEEVMHLTSMSRSAVYRSPIFKWRITMGRRCVRWPESEVLRFVETLKRQGRCGA